MTAIMDKETWIKSRTDNPNKLGRNVWISFYELRSKGMQLPPESMKALKPLYIDMEREFLIKMGLPPNVNDSNWKLILNHMGNTDLNQSQEAMKMGLSVVLGLGVPAPQKPTKAPTEKMDKETWIKSRTKNPDRIGKDVWGAMYDFTSAGKNLSPTDAKELKPLHIEMVKDYFEKMGFSYSTDAIKRAADSQLWNSLLATMMQQAKVAPSIQESVIKSMMNQLGEKPKKSLLDTLKEASKKFLPTQNNKGRV